MANAAKEIRVSLKMLADVTDAKKLTEYIDKLDEGLKQAGGASADALSKKLADIRKSLGKSDGAAGTVKNFASQVAAMMPDMSKSKALGSLDTIEKKLASFGTAQAKAIIGTVGKIRAAFQSGDLSEETVDLLSTSFEKLVQQAQKLPPPQMAKLGKDMRGLIDNTQELKDVVEAVNGIDFKIDLTGNGSVGELFQKMNIAESANELNQSLDSLTDHMADFGDAGGDAATEIHDKFKKVIEGPLGKDSIKALKDVEAQAVKMAASLSGKDLLKAGPILQDVIRKSKALQEELKKTGNAAVDGFDAVDAVISEGGIHVGQLEQGIVAIASKIPGIGKAIKALPMPWVLALIGAIVALAKSTWDYFADMHQRTKDVQFGNLERSIKSMNRDFEIENHLHDMAIARQNQQLNLIKEQQAATNSLTRSQMEYDKALEMAKAITQEQKSAVERKYERKDIDQNVKEKRETLANERTAKKNEVEDIEKQIEMAKAKIESTRELAEDARRSGRRNKKSIGVTNVFSMSDADDMARYEDKANELQASVNDQMMALEKLEERLREAKKQKKLIDSKDRDKEIDNAEATAKKDADIQDRDENLRKTAIREQREREEELRRRSESEKERDYQRGLSEQGMGGDKELANQQVEFERWLKREEEMLAKRRRIFDEWQKANPGEVEMDEATQRHYNEATADLDEARTNRYSAQERIDALKFQLRKSAHARSREEELYEYDRELAESEYQRGKRQPWQNYDEQLVEAKKMLARFQGEENEALEEREKILKRMRDENRTEMNEEEATRFSEVTNDLLRARSSRYREQSNVDSLQKQIHDRQFEESETQYQYQREDRDWERQGRYSRANYAQRLRMDIERYREGQKQFEEAQRRIDADNNGTATLSPEQRKIVERNRNEGREKMTSMRESIRSAAYEGDSATASFVSSLFSHRNRLTAMGLGGDVASWDRMTANNTREMIVKSEEIRKAIDKLGIKGIEKFATWER